MNEKNIKDMKFDELDVMRDRVMDLNDLISELLTHRGEDALRSEERLKEAQHIARIGSWEWTPEGELAACSEEIYSIFDFEKGRKITLETFLRTTHPEDRDRVRARFEAALAGNGDFVLDHRLALADCVVKNVRHDARIVAAPDKSPRLSGTVQDITERKRMEDELLKNQKIESIGTLAGVIAHDFNNLLQGILGNVSLARELVSSGDRLYHHLSEIEKAALRSKDLTRRLLTFSKGGEPIKAVAQAAELLSDSTKLIMRNSPSKYEFRVDIAPDLLPIEADEGLICQAVSNLLLNAREAMPSGGVVSLCACNREPGKGLPDKPAVEITIADSGAGIAHKHAERIFDPFFTTKENRSGLGLATASSIVSKHGGRITFASEQGRGTVFTILLPAIDKNALPETGSNEKLLRGVGRVLVVDDEEVVRDVVGEMLRHLGYEAHFASEGSQAIEMYRGAMIGKKPFDAVIMDLTIPRGMGGKDAIRLLKDIDPDIKAIVSSGYSRDPIMSEYAAYGFCACISKPFRVSEFSRKLKEALTKN